MTNKISRFILMAALIILPMLWSAGGADAYLQPIPPTDGNGTVTGDPSGPPRLVEPGEPADYLTTANWAYTPLIRKFIDPLPGICIPTADNENCEADYVNTDPATKFIPIAVPDVVTYPGSDYYEIELYQFEESMHSDLPPTTLRGYRQIGLATDVSLCDDPTNPDSCIGENPTLVNTLNFSNSNGHYLGPIIVAQKDRPVRVKFVNSLPIGAGGDLFVPVDETVMGAGDYEIDFDPVTKEPLGSTITGKKFTQNRGELHLHGGRTPWISDGTPHQWITPAGDPWAADYPQGVSVVDVPDMPLDPTLDPTDPNYSKINVGDDGIQTYYWTNQQSARLMFYHDHAWGITRLNVYVGGAAGYVIRDETEETLVAEGILPTEEIPLVIQDKTYIDATEVTDPNSGDPVAAYKLTDPTWDWGIVDPDTGTRTTPKTGDLWWPHVYMPAQNPFDITGIAPMGRWAYGPYFWPATNNPYQPEANPYYNVDCNVNDPAQNETNTFGYTMIGDVPFCQPPEVPSTPNPSWGAEAFMDTPTVNGTAYPVMNVDPKAYRLRILNASHDRFFNLQMYRADGDDTLDIDPILAPADHCNGVSSIACDRITEVKMLDAAVYPDAPATWPADGREGGVPDWNKVGPEWIMYASEGGFLPQPVVIPNNPVTWNADVTTFNAGNVNGGSLILGPAERADTVVDFSAYAGQTLILYNDAPAPWPALDPHYDYYTGAPDYTDIGGAPSTMAGFGPNTRTIMKIVVSGSTPTGGTFSLQAMQDAFDPAPEETVGVFGNGDSVFEHGQDPLIVGQGDMNPSGDPAFYEAFLFDNDYSAIDDTYDSYFPTNWPNWGVARINDKALHFVGTDGSTTYTYDTQDTSLHHLDNTSKLYGGVPMEFKAIQDEQGETFDDYGRMRAGLGLELVNPGAGQVNFMIQTYSDPATEILEENGLQVWKITHNGVDTHPVHFHLYDVQVLNRVGWDGFIRLPDPTEMGWKDTVRISPLEDTIVALRPVTPQVPFGIPESIRPLNPARTAYGTTEISELTQIDPYTGATRDNYNRLINLDWEYVWHCHILSHEENDMMRPQSFLFTENLPGTPAILVTSIDSTHNNISWTDSTPVNYLTGEGFGAPDGEIGYRLERSTDGGPYELIANILPNVTNYVDTVNAGTLYNYQVTAFNAKGSTTSSNSVVITSPLNGSIYASPTSLTITTSVASSITSVDFYYGNTLLGTDTSAPFEYLWENVPNGTYQLVARGYDSLSQEHLSEPVNVTVATVHVDNPNGGEELYSGQTYTVNWTATPNATKFHLRYNDGTGWKLIKAFATGSNYVWTVPDYIARQDNIVFHISAMDDSGTQLGWDMSDAPFAINPTAISITAPATGTYFGTLDTVNLSANTAPMITSVEFYNGATLLGTVNSAPFNFNWTNVPKGIHSITARGFDSLAQSYTSAPVTVNVVTVHVDNPNGSEQLTSNQFYTVNWTATPTATKFHLRYNDGSGWKLIKAFATGNSYVWTVPTVAVQNTNVTFHISAMNDAGTQLGWDASDAPFTINPITP